MVATIGLSLHLRNQEHPMSEPRPGIALPVYRLIVWLAVAAAVVLVITRPFAPFPEAEAAPAINSGINYYEALAEARSMADSNEKLAKGAPQQQVVNGWLTNDQLEIIGHQNSELLERLRVAQTTHDAAVALEQDQWRWEMKDRRIESLLVIFGLGAAAHLAGSAIISLVTALRARRKPTAAPQGWPQNRPQLPHQAPFQQQGTWNTGARPSPSPAPQPSAPEHGRRPQYPGQPPTDYI